MADCLDCKHSYVDDLFHELRCRKAGHFCRLDDDGSYYGILLMKEGWASAVCKDFKEEKND